MFAEVTHRENFTFESTIREHTFLMDTKQAAGGNNQGPSPKELVLSCILGCTGMDLIAIFKKQKVSPKKLHITANAEPRQEHPRVFTSIHLMFDLEDDKLSADTVFDAVRQSLTKFCGVSAMVSKVSPISYEIRLNGKQVGEGHAEFVI